ncbi:hypothetical protein [Bradyrhizobium sp. 6(2017)]|uniref:hypothetical protein n=1 Tax=Bradyrhizobium sp. 6(2017) TaxID=1197460 RepID=UPI0013E0FE40|nr:hypothetical protein [Bradyrhizobium sp. 6(2017)]QIG94121.1 hypothetical protein G6P99_17580 [Bradyrhizobium sp. 6(2017)]
MALHFRRVDARDELEIWTASSDAYSFVITHEARSGPGFHGAPGFVASWRSLYVSNPAIKVGGSPFKSLAEAERACEALLKHLTGNGPA